MRLTACLTAACLAAAPAGAATFQFGAGNFDTLTPLFSNVTTFDFRFTVTVPLAPGGSYTDPRIGGVDYSVSGALSTSPPTPSGFPAFALNRPETAGQSFPGTEFYAQGSSLSFMILASADLSDGLQLSEIDGTFILNAREVDTGRYHPPILTLNSDGTGALQNSNNFGATTTNPATGELVDVDFGDEYVTILAVDPTSFTLAAAPLNADVPLPPALLLLGSALMGLVVLSRRPA